jgi:hypothetical protein
MTTYTSPFGGDVIQPTDVSYVKYTLTASITLAWPLAAGAANIAARIMDVSSLTTGAYSMSMPPANQTANGTDALIRNLSAYTVTIYDSTGATITTIQAGVAKYIFVSDNSTAAGTWGVFTFGAGTSSNDASVLAGYGLLAVGSTLNQNYSSTPLVSSYTFTGSDRAKCFVWSSGATTVTLPLSANVDSGWFILFKNNGTGTVTVQGTSGELIDGLSTKQFAPGDSAFLLCTGTGYVTVGYGTSTTFAFSAITKVISSGAVTMSVSEAQNTIITFTGTLTGNVTVTFPPIVNLYVLANQTTAGSYTITITTGTGTTVVLPLSGQATVGCDGANFYNANTNITSGSAFALANGSVSAPSLSFLAESNTGLYRVGVGEIALSILGTQRLSLSTSGVVVTGSGRFTGGVSGGSF